MPNRKCFNSNEEYNAWYREYRRKNANKIRAYNRIYNNAWRKENGYESEERAKKKFPFKEASRRILRYAVRVGKIKRGACEDCGKPNGQGHHDDYFKPLEVVWLCSIHHARRHKRGV